MSETQAILEHLLVVDPEPEARDSISNRLRNSGYQVSSAPAGKQVLEQLNETAFALIVLDRALTDLQTLKQIRAKHSPAILPVIYLTDGTQKLAEALDAGANDYIARPIDYPVALGRIRAQLDRRAAELAAVRASQDDSPTQPGQQDAGWADVVWDWDLATGSTYLSERWADLTGLPTGRVFYTAEEFFAQILSEDQPVFTAAMDALRAGETTEASVQFRALRPDGESRLVHARARVLRDSAGLATRITGSLTDLTSSHTRDPLTGLPLRQYLLHRLAAELERTRSGEAGPMGVLLIDLDHFQHYDEPTGKALLVEVARRLDAAVSSLDEAWRKNPASAGGRGLLLARLGGDRFAVLVEGLRTSSEAIRVAEGLIREFRRPFVVNGQSRDQRASLGIATYAVSHRTPQDLLRDADIALDRAKHYGRDRWEIFSDDMRVQVVYRLHFENALRRALEQQEFRVAYQPIIDLSNRKIVGLEALLRWPTFGLGTCRLEEVIRVAEETGLIVEIGRWVLREACLQMRQIHQFFPRAPRLSLHVNVSEKQFSLDDLDQVVGETLRETGMAPQQLKLEVTEPALMHQRRDMRETLERLKSRSVRLGIDDFGTGYASLDYLHQFPFDTLKLDRTFISRLGAPGTNPEIGRAVIHLAQSMQMEVVAEGIEDEQQVSLMQGLGCGFGQGYLFAHPMLAHQLLMSVLSKHFS
ncbi:MAG: EAL domain-containing protein [Bryobacteraceae bacterium]|nr:EAL domain-containing protein [Bryobacteraceae bacterium]